MAHRRIQLSVYLVGLVFILAIAIYGCSAQQNGALGGLAQSSSTPVPPSATPTSTATPQPTPTNTPTPSPTPTFIPYLSMANAVYQNGQTFVTWQERDDLRGEIYRVYRSSEPISAETLPNATLLGAVGKNSAAFYTNRYQILDDHTWKVRYSDRLTIQENGPALPAGTGLLVWTLSAQDFGGEQQGDGYYAVIVSLPGRDGTLDARAAIGPIAEAVAVPAPVEITQSQPGPTGPGGHVYIQYMDLRSWNPTFHAPNATNKYYGLAPDDPDLVESLQYAYDYTVFSPTADLCGGNLPQNLPVILHLHGWTDFTNSAPAEYPDKACAYGIYPVDVTNTWYFGFSRKHDYRKSSQVESGDTIVNYTEQRVLRMLYDLERNPPGPAVDPERIYVAGESMGGTGSLSFGERYPNIFAAAYVSQPITNFRTAGVTREDWAADVSVKWGSQELDLPVENSGPSDWAKPLEKYNGTGVWEWQDYLANASGALKGRIADEMAPMGIIHGYRDQVVLWDSQGKPVQAAFDAGRRAWGGLVTDDDHYWMYYIGLPPTIGARGADKVTHVPFWRLHVVKNETVPGLGQSSGNQDYTDAAPGAYNQTVMWSSSWNKWDAAPIDQPYYWQMSFCTVALDTQTCGGSALTVTVTPRRVQQFIITPGAVYNWENRSAVDNSLVASGTVTADADGLITVPDFQVSPEGNRLIIAPQLH